MLGELSLTPLELPSFTRSSLTESRIAGLHSAAAAFHTPARQSLTVADSRDLIAELVAVYHVLDQWWQTMAERASNQDATAWSTLPTNSALFDQWLSAAETIVPLVMTVPESQLANISEWQTLQDCLEERRAAKRVDEKLKSPRFGEAIRKLPTSLPPSADLNESLS